MSLVIIDSNSDKINSELAKVNQGSTSHTYNNVYDLLDVIKKAFSKLDRLPKVSKAELSGVVLKATSGSPVPKSYRFSRTATQVELKLGADGLWRLINISKVSIGNYGGKEKLIFNEKHLKSLETSLRKMCGFI